jgi:hypothetical protein
VDGDVLMAGTTIDWYGPQVVRDLEAAVERGMEKAGEALVAGIVRKISRPAPPASRPGQPPHRRSGGLARSVTHRVERRGGEMVLTVGVFPGAEAEDYSAALQQGTSRMSARPYLDDLRQAVTAGAAVVSSIEDEARGRFR